MRRLAVALAVAVVLVVQAAPAAADPASPSRPSRTGRSAVGYRPPVPGPVVDAFRPPAQAWGAGNRGVDYATRPGSPVGAAGDGEVVFAGSVAATLHVVVLHADGVRTSYSFLQSIRVHRGDRVTQGQPVGTAGDRLHFGARVGDTYVDPAVLFGAGPPEVHLVPHEELRPASEAHERSKLREGLAGLARLATGAAGEAADWARGWGGSALPGPGPTWTLTGFGRQFGRLRGVVSGVRDLHPGVIGGRGLQAIADWYTQRGRCTPAGATAGALRPGEHLAVTVAGFDSSSGDVGIDHLDTTALGYAADDVQRFSYAGGTITDNPYDGRVTSQDIRISARRLRQLLQRLAEAHPGVPVDILAHSQGGIVAREALAMEADPGDGDLPPINALVLLGVPNTGTDLATASVMLGQSRSGDALFDALATARPRGGDLGGTSVQQLAETSVLLARLNDRPLPPGVHVTSIGARTDPVVPARHTRLEGAYNVIVDSGGVSTHAALPGSAAALWEAALAIQRRPPTCQALANMIADQVVTETISLGSDALGIGAWATGLWVDTLIATPPVRPFDNEGSHRMEVRP